MAYDIPMFDVTFKAAADLTAAQYLGAKLDSNGEVIKAVAGDAQFILQNTPKLGTAARVRVHGISLAMAAGTIVAGERVTTDADGKFVKATKMNADITAATGASATVKAASAVTDTLTVTLDEGSGEAGNALSIVLTTAGGDTLAVTKNDTTGAISIALANTTASKNTAALIQAAIRALKTVKGVSVLDAVCEAAGNWDTAAIATGEAGGVAFTGGGLALSFSGTQSVGVALKGASAGELFSVLLRHAEVVNV